MPDWPLGGNFVRLLRAGHPVAPLPDRERRPAERGVQRSQASQVERQLVEALLGGEHIEREGSQLIGNRIGVRLA